MFDPLCTTLTLVLLGVPGMVLSLGLPSGLGLTVLGLPVLGLPFLGLPVLGLGARGSTLVGGCEPAIDFLRASSSRGLGLPRRADLLPSELIPDPGTSPSDFLIAGASCPHLEVNPFVGLFGLI